jgi:hypothetical protein
MFGYMAAVTPGTPESKTMSQDALHDTASPCFFSETDSVMSALDLTRMAVQVAYKHSKSWRTLATEKGVSHNVLYALAHGEWSKVSWETHRLVRRKFDLPDPGPLVYATPCPTCGGIHIAGDCHGVPIASVAILRPGEVVAAAGDVVKRTTKARLRKTVRKNISVDPVIWEASNARRIAAGMTWDAWEAR